MLKLSKIQYVAETAKTQELRKLQQKQVVEEGGNHWPSNDPGCLDLAVAKIPVSKAPCPMANPVTSQELVKHQSKTTNRSDVLNDFFFGGGGHMTLGLKSVLLLNTARGVPHVSFGKFCFQCHEEGV